MSIKCFNCQKNKGLICMIRQSILIKLLYLHLLKIFLFNSVLHTINETLRFLVIWRHCIFFIFLLVTSLQRIRALEAKKTTVNPTLFQTCIKKSMILPYSLHHQGPRHQDLPRRHRPLECHHQDTAPSHYQRLVPLLLLEMFPLVPGCLCVTVVERTQSQ